MTMHSDHSGETSCFAPIANDPLKQDNSAEVLNFA